MCIESVMFSRLEGLIRCGGGDLIRSREFLSVLRAQPALARQFDEFGASLMMIAADAGNMAAVEALCDLGGDVNAVSDSGETSLVNAIRFKPEDDFAWREKIEIVRALFKYGADPNLIAFQGCCALHWAVIEGDPLVVDIVLRNKGNPDLFTEDRFPVTAMEILRSGRFRGCVSQREMIFELLNAKAR